MKPLKKQERKSKIDESFINNIRAYVAAARTPAGFAEYLADQGIVARPAA